MTEYRDIIRSLDGYEEQIWDCATPACTGPLFGNIRGMAEVEGWLEGRARVGDDFLAKFKKAFYSVPYQFIGVRMVALRNNHSVRIFQGITEIALHARELTWRKFFTATSLRREKTSSCEEVPEI
jgi:hypothetical protein